LVIDASQMRNELAKNWGWIVASGALNMVFGVLALALPIFATEVAYTGTTITIGASGVVGLLNIFFAQTANHKVKSGISGALFVALALYMNANPAAGLDIITLSVASAIALEGLYETVLALKNEDIQARGLHFVSGVGSVLAAAWLGFNIPATSLFFPGVALGARLTSNGATKVAVGLEGKKLAAKMEK